jgi:hypothetical protein
MYPSRISKDKYFFLPTFDIYKFKRYVRVDMNNIKKRYISEEGRSNIDIRKSAIRIPHIQHR